MTKEKSTEESDVLEAETENAGHAAKFVVIFPDGLAEKLRKQAKDEDKLVSEFVREIVRDFMNDELPHGDTCECDDCQTEDEPDDDGTE